MTPPRIRINRPAPRNAAGSGVTDPDQARVVWPERAAKALRGAFQIEAANAFQAVALDHDAQRQQRREIGFGGGCELELGLHAETAQTGDGNARPATAPPTPPAGSWHARLPSRCA